jgi:hypothetical protein
MDHALNLTFWAMMGLSFATVLLALRVPAAAGMHAPAKAAVEPAE